MSAQVGPGSPTVVFGHRGAAGEAPENTLGGFAYAYQAGVRAFELDIRLSKDAELVVIHDPSLDRTTDGSGPVKNLSRAELSRLNAAHSFPDWPAREGVPALEEVLERYHSRIAEWQFEIKTDSRVPPETISRLLTKLIARYGLLERATITSFDPRALAIARRSEAQLTLGLIFAPGQPIDTGQARSLGCSELCIPVSSGSPGLISSLQKAGFRVTGWLGNRSADLERLLGWGVEAITTDVPSFAIPYIRGWQEGEGKPG